MQFSEQNKRKAVTFSYDDGVTQDIRLIELLNKYGLKATFNLNSELLGKSGMLTRADRRVSHYKITPEDVPVVYAGHEVAAHTLTHPMLPDLPDDEVIRQVERDRLNLSELVGYEVVGMAYPGGGVNYDDRVVKLIRQQTGVRYARTTVLTDCFDRQQDLYQFLPNAYHIMDFDRLMEMGRQFLELQPAHAQIFYIWGHSYEMDFMPGGWEHLEAFFKLIAGHDDIFYGTNAEVLLS